MDISESDIVQGLADDLGLTRKDTIGDLIGALRDEEAECKEEDDD